MARVSRRQVVRNRWRVRVVVVGAGFAGLAACETLAKADVEVLLIDRHTYSTFQPLLYQVATAGLYPGDIAYPVRWYLRKHGNVDFRQGDVTGVDFGARKVFCRDGAAVSYDFLVIASGAAINFFGVPGAAEHSRAIYSMEDAIAVRTAGPAACGVRRAPRPLRRPVARAPRCGSPTRCVGLRAHTVGGSLGLRRGHPGPDSDLGGRSRTGGPGDCSRFRQGTRAT